MTPVRHVVVEEVPGCRPGAESPGDTLGLAIDVLRATSTLSVACSNGVAGIVPFAETAAALSYRDRAPGVLVCGEREGRIVPGFDLGNSPHEYAPGRVTGRVLAFASTNGSRAMLALADARDRRLAAFVNASAAVAHCLASSAPVVRMVCAGKEGEPTAEDSGCAAWIASRLAAHGFRVRLADGGDPAAFLARAPRDAAAVRARVEQSEHGRYLAALGESFAADVVFCATLDRLERCDGW